MSSLLVLILCLTAIQCQDICHLIQPSKHFNGLHVYHSQPSDKLFMFENGIQWQFDIKWYRSDYTLEVIPNSNQTIDSKIINMFGGYGTRGYEYDCNVKHQTPDKSKIVTNCSLKTIDTDTVSQYNPNSVVFKATEGDNNWLIIFDKNGPKISCYDTRLDPKERLKDEAECHTKITPFPKFITDMKPDLLKSINGVVDYTASQQFGHFLFFNINGRPKYCFQRIDKDLQCNSNDVLKPLFEECFRGSGDQNGYNILWWILGGILVVGIIVVIFVISCKHIVNRLWPDIPIRSQTTRTSALSSTETDKTTQLESTAMSSTGNTSNLTDSGVTPSSKTASTKPNPI